MLLHLHKLCVCLRPYTVNAYLNISMKTECPQPAQVVSCMHLHSISIALCAQSAVELEPDMQHITLASHTSRALAHASIYSPQVEFELLEGV